MAQSPKDRRQTPETTPAGIPADLPADVHRIGLYDAYLATLGGGENLLAVFAELLEEEFPGAAVEILTHRENAVPLERLVERFGVTLERTRVRPVEPGRRRRPVLFHPLRRFLHERDVAELSSRYDLFVNNTVFSVAPARSRYSIYMCMFPLTAEPWELRQQPVRRRLLWPYVLLRRHLYRRWVSTYDLLLGISHFTRLWIRRLWDLDSELLYPPVKASPRLSLDRKERRILAIGRFFPGNHNKKHDVLIEAMGALVERGLEGWQLHLVGGKTAVDGTEAYLDHLRTLAAGLPVHFHIDAPRRQLEELLATSSLFWHATGFDEPQEAQPEKLEHFGITTVEAMSHGCVPLAFHCGGQPEIIAHGESGYLWRTRGDLLEHSLQLAHDPRLRESLARAAHGRSLDFSREAFKRRARQLLRQLTP